MPESHSCHRRCAKLLIQHDDLHLSLMHILLLIRLTISTLCDLFKLDQPGSVLHEGNIIFDLGLNRMLRNVLRGDEAKTVDTAVTVQVCQSYLVQQLRVGLLLRAKEQVERIQTQRRLSKGLSWHQPHNGKGVSFPI